MKNNALKSRKMAFVFVMIGALLIFPSIGERAAAEEGSVTALSGDRPRTIGWVPVERVLKQKENG